VRRHHGPVRGRLLAHRDHGALVATAVRCPRRRGRRQESGRQYEEPGGEEGRFQRSGARAGEDCAKLKFASDDRASWVRGLPDTSCLRILSVSFLERFQGGLDGLSVAFLVGKELLSRHRDELLADQFGQDLDPAGVFE
jgi:hypothetical protein